MITVDASRDFYFIFSERAAWGRGGGGALPDVFLFPVQQTTSGIDHHIKYCSFFGLATNTLNVRNIGEPV